LIDPNFRPVMLLNPDSSDFTFAQAFSASAAPTFKYSSGVATIGISRTKMSNRFVTMFI
jgi:hypothetical protein